ncbi:hypothetical protein GQX74_013288 [Glossina fuscipes]|nr:hypothetical protein GQX74_013288 [Glossina fuscipes]
MAHVSFITSRHHICSLTILYEMRDPNKRYMTTCLEVDEAANLCLHILKPNALSTQFLIQDKLFLCRCLRHEKFFEYSLIVHPFDDWVLLGPKIYPPFRERTSSIRLGEECLTSRLVMNLQSSFLCCRLFFLISGCQFEIIFFAWYCLTDNDNKFKHHGKDDDILVLSISL